MRVKCVICLGQRVKMMIYCRLKEKHKDSAVYYAGSFVDDMTGEIIFFKGENVPVLSKQAEKYPILRYRIM